MLLWEGDLKGIWKYASAIITSQYASIHDN